MCGIAGLMTIDGTTPAADVLDRLTEALGHRGPDGDGRLVAGGIGLVQTRLAIIDLETGDQPIYASHGAANQRAAIVANGEIYNYVELRQQLRDVAFATRSDCEPPLHLYLRHGLEFTRHLRGMYALAIHDPEHDRLVLARDPFGIKPLYYIENSRGFAFASEPSALISAGLAEPTLRADGRDELLQLQFTTGRETIFAGIERVLPGETLAVERGRVVERRRLDALPEAGVESMRDERALSDLDSLLNDTVGIHQRSDVPYAMFLSGGVDSSVLLAMMARLNPRPVHAFTAGFPDTQAADEREHAKVVARAARAEHHEVAVRQDDFVARLPAVVAALDDPTADYAALPTFLLAERARAEGFKVVLTGEGGDELFAGYGRYRSYVRPRIFGGRDMRRRGTFDDLDLLRGGATGWRDGIVSAEAEARAAGGTPLQIAQAMDCADWLPNDLLNKVDRCLMAHGVEGRVPFLDTEMAKFAYRLPDKLKVRRSHGKWLLRRWLDSGLPVAKPFDRKRGFTVPVAAWIVNLGSRLGPLVAAQPGIAEACRPDRVEALFAASGKHEGQAAWALLFYALWHQHHVLRRPAGGDIFEVLAA